MSQLELFIRQPRRLETQIERKGDELCMPEGLHTIPCTHGLHRFPGKFVPNIPRYILRHILPLTDSRVVFDPFCGSGTTLVEAALENRPFIGVDIDPLSVMIANVKVTPLSESELHLLDKFWNLHDYDRQCMDVIPNVPNLGHWFQAKTIRQLSSIKKKCYELSPKLRDFSLVVFSSIIRRVSNADDQTQKTYVSRTLPKSPPPVSELFPVFLERAIEGMREYRALLPSDPRGEITRGDARTDICDFIFDDIVTSPPYIDSIDYVYNQMLEYFWLLPELSIYTYDQFRKIRKEPMGVTHAFRKGMEDTVVSYLPSTAKEYRALCTRIGTKSRKEEQIIHTFFFEYIKYAEAVYKKQTRGGYYVCVVGNSYIRGVTVPTVRLIEEIHQKLGYVQCDRLTYEIRRHYMKFPRRSNSRKIKHDYVLVFKVD